MAESGKADYMEHPAAAGLDLVGTSNPQAMSMGRLCLDLELSRHSCCGHSCVEGSGEVHLDSELQLHRRALSVKPGGTLLMYLGKMNGLAPASSSQAGPCAVLCKLITPLAVSIARR